MKLEALLGVFLFGSAVAQNGYNVNVGSANLPTNPQVQTYVPTVTQDVQVPKYPSADLLKLILGSTNSRVTETNTKNTISSAQQQISVPVRSFESLFTKLPSNVQLIKLANDGDVAGISRTIRKLSSDDSIPCQAKISYLLQLSNIIKKELSAKNLAADQTKAIIDGAKTQIQRLNGQIDRLKKSREDLNLQGKQSKLNDKVLFLRKIYQQVNTVRRKIPPEEARVAGIQREIATITKQNQQQRNKVNNNKIKLNEINNLIKQIQTKITDTKAQKTALQNSIQASASIIKQNDGKISNMRTTITDIQDKIIKLKDTLDRLNREANTLQIDEQRARTDLSIAEAEDQGFLQEKKGYEAKIALEKPKLVQDQLNKIKVLINNLKKIEPEIKDQIDKQYYYCYGGGNVNTQNQGSVIVYVVKGQAFGHYIETAYGQSVNAPHVSSGLDYKLQVVDPYSKIWTAKYGYPWVAEDRSDFSCISGNGSTNSGSGLITGINNNGITITDANGKEVSLTVGSCSRIQSTEQLPKVGHHIVYKGAPNSKGSVNIHGATCWGQK